MRHNWNPDPRWPEHIVGVCIAIANGEDCTYALVDALLEEGLDKLANNAGGIGKGVGMINDILTSGVTVGLILNDGWLYGGCLASEAEEYLNKRGSNVTA